MCGPAQRKSRGQLVETNSDRLAEVHRGLAGIGGYGEKAMAVGEVVAGEPVLLRAEDEGHAASPGEFVADDRRERGEFNDWLLGLAGFERAGAEDECCGG